MINILIPRNETHLVAFQLAKKFFSYLWKLNVNYSIHNIRTVTT
jgi:hypothetical protein